NDGDGTPQEQTKTRRDEILARLGRKDQNETVPFDQGGKTRNAKRHQEKSKPLPLVQRPRAFRRRAGDDDQRDSDNNAETEGSEPERRSGVEVTDQDDRVPDQVGPKNQTASGELRQILEHVHSYTRML